jgi:hypothetical protein
MFEVWGCGLVKQKFAQETGDGQNATVIAVPALLYCTLLSTIAKFMLCRVKFPFSVFLQIKDF